MFFFQFFNSPVALKNLKKIWPSQKKVEMTPLTDLPKYLIMDTSRNNCEGCRIIEVHLTHAVVEVEVGAG